MKLLVFITLLALIASESSAGRVKKNKHESSNLNKKLTGKAAKRPPAIIAIEIVDPNENKTKTTKRTIDSSLGYGYEKYSTPKYQVYKYSQHDIPPYQGPPQHFSRGINAHQYDIQKSVSYQLPSIKSQEHSGGSLTQYYRPGTTLFSTVNTHGQAGGLTSHLPQQQYGNEPQVPVIILRVYPNQLTQPGALHANLPQSHPLASTINSLDIQSLLSKYVQNVQQPHYQQQPQQQHYQEPESQYYDPPQPQYEAPAPQEYEQQPPSPQYQYIPHQQYQESYSHQQQQESSNAELLTHENYPKETHTRVVFRTDKNKLGVTPSDSKTIPSAVASPELQSYTMVQVQLPDMQYSYGSEENNNGQVYFYHGDHQNQQQQQSGNNIQPESYYQQNIDQDAGYEHQPQEDRTQVVYEQQPPVPQTYTYHDHNHQKRSKKRARSHRSTEEFTLGPIKA